MSNPITLPKNQMQDKKIALVCDWLVTYAGAERVIEQILECFPQADIFAVCDFVPPQERSFLKGKKVRTSFIQKLPWAAKKYRGYLPLMPLAIEQLDVSQYDIVISSSHAVAKGILTGPQQLHISYVHTPLRYAWDLQHQYLKEANLERGLKSFCARLILHFIRLWDYRSAQGVDFFLANSNFIAQRIQKCYRRNTTRVIYPPVAVEKFPLCLEKDDYYITASRLVPYKKVDLIVETFAQMPDKKLIVIGDGPEAKKIKGKLSSNITFLGYQEFAVLKTYLEKAKAFVFAAEEDFGISPVEAQACGTPVIAFGKGGARETILGLESPTPTGVFFYQQTVEALREAIQEFEKNREKITPHNCRSNAERFSSERFRREFKETVTELIAQKD